MLKVSKLALLYFFKIFLKQCLLVFLFPSLTAILLSISNNSILIYKYTIKKTYINLTLILKNLAKDIFKLLLLK